MILRAFYCLRHSPRREHWPGLAAAILFLLTPCTVLADIFGLVVGINEYRHERNLQGAVNDAIDIKTALNAVGAREVIALLNGEASRVNIKAHWERLAKRAKPGDTLVFTFAGHGAQEPEHVPGSEADGRDEVLVLGGFQETRPGNGERILDNELNQWFSAASQFNIVFIADTCHSGTLTRLPDRRADLFGERLIGDYGPIEDEELPPSVILAKPDGEEPAPHVTFLAASQDNEKIREVNIDGQPRGALSWTFARALEGQADTDRNGVLDRAELRRYVVEAVRMQTEFRQHPNLAPTTETSREILPAGMTTTPEVPPTLSLRILGVSDAEAGALLKRLQGVSAAAQDQLPDLIWDPGKQEILSAHGDVIAQLRAPGPEPVQNVIDKWRLLATVKRLSASHSLELRLEPDDHLHRQGAIVSFTLSGHRYSHLLLFNLASDGTLQFLYPLPRDPQTVSIDEPFRLREKIKVLPPFGADHLVAITTPAAPQSLQTGLRRLNGEPSAAALNRLFQETDWGTYQMGVLGLYTAP